MKNLTFMIPINQGISFRYIIQTDIFKELQKKANKVILLLPNPSDSFYEDLNKYSNVFIEDYREQECKDYLEASSLHRRLKMIRNFVQNNDYDISTTEGHHNVFIKDYSENINKNKTRMFLLWFFNKIIFLSRGSKLLRRLILFLENAFFTPIIHSDYFDKYKPDVLLVTSLGTFDYDQLFMRQANKYGLKIVSVIQSWDNTTTRGYPAASCDLIITWTDIMKKELIELNDINKSKIEVGGVALYDHYYKKENFYSKNELYDILKIDKDLDLIFSATKSPNCYVSNDFVSKLIIDSINNNNLEKNVQLLVRMHPIFYRRTNGELVFSKYIKDFDKLSEDNPRITINHPEIQSLTMNYSMPPKEIKLLASVLKHSSLILNVFSSLNIEASIFDIPIINIAFEDRTPSHIKKSRLDINLDLNESHNARIIKSKGIEMVYDKKNLIRTINDQLKNPTKNKKGRMLIAKNEAGPNKGVAGKKIVELIYNKFN